MVLDDKLDETDLRNVFRKNEYIKYVLKYTEENNIKIHNKIINSIMNRVVKYENGERTYDKEVVEILIKTYETALKLSLNICSSLDDGQIEWIYNTYKEKILEERKNISTMYRVCEVFCKQIDSNYLIDLVSNICIEIDTIHGNLIFENLYRFNLTEDEKDIIEGKIILLKLAV